MAQAGLALTDLRQGDAARALGKMEAVLAVAKIMTPDGPDTCFAGLVAVEVLSAHRERRAEAILDQLYNHLQTQAAQIKDDAQRAIFLKTIPEHREIVAAWGARGRT